MDLSTHGSRKYSTSTLLQSSAGLGWSTISAELRSHAASETPVIVPQNVEVIFAVAGNDDGLVIRTGGGQRQETRPSTGVFCVTPAGVDNQLPLRSLFHERSIFFLPTAQFRKLADDFNLPGEPARSIRYVAGVRDELVYQIGLSIISAMTDETAAGRMFVETASAALAARLLQTYWDGGAGKSLEPATQRVDHARLRRALDYISANLDEEITLAQLAQVAGVSVSHFACTSPVPWASRPAATSAACGWRRRWPRSPPASCRWPRSPSGRAFPRKQASPGHFIAQPA
jgi:AraC family transcriptional regulator